MGRVHSKRRVDVGKEQRWRAVMERFAGSGLSARAFCRKEGLAEPSFCFWRRELKKREGVSAEPRASSPMFLPVELKAEATSQPAVEIVLRGGRVLRLVGEFNTRVLAELVAALEAQPC